jgi:GTP cyclohydrolase II
VLKVIKNDLVAEPDPLVLHPQEHVARMISDLRLGLPVLLADAGRTHVAVAVETLAQDRFEALRALGRTGELALTQRRASALFPSLEGSGDASDAPQLFALSDATPLQTVQKLVGPRIEDGSEDLIALRAQKKGGLVHEAALALAKAAQLLPAMLVWPITEAAAGILHREGLSALPSVAVMSELTRARTLAPVSAAPLPMICSEVGAVRVFRPDDGSIEHYAIEVGTVDMTRPVLARLHSACFTGDVLGSLKCDCGPQLRSALDAMAQAGGGIMIYLNQEGRGIGLANKMRAYALQAEGLDTVDANHQIGFEDDERDFRIGGAILAEMGITKVRLMTNNPAKVNTLDSFGIEVVERVPIKVGQTSQNANYLATKARRSGHLLS